MSELGHRELLQARASASTATFAAVPSSRWSVGLLTVHVLLEHQLRVLSTLNASSSSCLCNKEAPSILVDPNGLTSGSVDSVQGKADFPMWTQDAQQLNCSRNFCSACMRNALLIFWWAVMCTFS